MPIDVREWLWQIAAKKGVVAGVKALVGLVGVNRLAGWGISIDQELLASAAIGLLEIVRNWLKFKGMKWL